MARQFLFCPGLPGSLCWVRCLGFFKKKELSLYKGRPVFFLLVFFLGTLLLQTAAGLVGATLLTLHRFMDAASFAQVVLVKLAASGVVVVVVVDGVIHFKGHTRKEQVVVKEPLGILVAKEVGQGHHAIAITQTA
jgi:hypothetical protein